MIEFWNGRLSVSPLLPIVIASFRGRRLERIEGGHCETMEHTTTGAAISITATATTALTSTVATTTRTNPSATTVTVPLSSSLMDTTDVTDGMSITRTTEQTAAGDEEEQDEAIVRETHNYDVLLEPYDAGMNNGSQPKLRLIPSLWHVGNNRFQALLTMNSTQYKNNLQQKPDATNDGKGSSEATNNHQDEDDAAVVVERIIDTVSRHVVPNGRFLVPRNRERTEWEVLPREAVLTFVRQQFDQLISSKTSPVPKSPLSISPTPSSNNAITQTLEKESPTRSSSHGDSTHNTVRTKQREQPFALRRQSVRINPASIRSSIDDDDDDDDDDNIASTFSPLSTSQDMEDKESLLQDIGPMFTSVDDVWNDGEKKRRRRSSLLRRSLSESFIFTNASGNSNAASAANNYYNYNTGSNEEFRLFDKRKAMRKHTFSEEAMAQAASLVASLDDEQAALEFDDALSDQDQQQNGAEPSNNDGSLKPSCRSFSAASLSSLAPTNRIRSGSYDEAAGDHSHRIYTAEGLDVIFHAASRNFTVESHTGNNRLKVLMDLQTNSFMKAPQGKKESIVQEMQKTVKNYWGGRFLLENADGSYTPLLEHDVTSLLLSAFDQRAAASVKSQAEYKTTTSTAESLYNAELLQLPLDVLSPRPLPENHQHRPLQQHIVMPVQPQPMQLQLPQQAMIPMPVPSNNNMSSNAFLYPPAHFEPETINPNQLQQQAFMMPCPQPNGQTVFHQIARETLMNKKKRQEVESKIRNLTAVTRSANEPIGYLTSMGNTTPPPSNAGFIDMTAVTNSNEMMVHSYGMSAPDVATSSASFLDPMASTSAGISNLRFQSNVHQNYFPGSGDGRTNSGGNGGTVLHGSTLNNNWSWGNR